MDWPDVERRIAGGENARTEFKRGVGDLGGVGRTLCAFANGDGGLLVIGVDDAGAVVGVGENPETVQERLTGFLQTGCGKPVTAMRKPGHGVRVGALERHGRRRAHGTPRSWLVDDAAYHAAMRRFNGTEPDLVNDERNRFVRVTFVASHAQ